MVINKNSYEKKYKEGYGIQYPESHIIRIYEHFLKEILIEKNIVNILDFGCGNGIHANYFAEKGFYTLGLDISENAISIANRNKSELSEFLHIDFLKENIKFEKKFDLIIANQSIYYLSPNEISELMNKLDEVLDDEGYVVFTMMSTGNYYFNYAVPLENGMYDVELKGRLNEKTQISFIDSDSHLIQIFNKFLPLYTGKYDLTLKEGSSEHFYFIGKKHNATVS